MVKTKDSQGGAKSTVTVLFLKEDGFMEHHKVWEQ